MAIKKQYEALKVKKRKAAVFIMALAPLLLVACVNHTAPSLQFETAASPETENVPAQAPLLEVSFIADNLPIQSVQAAQLTTSWFYVDENGNGSGIEADSPHPLQLSDYSRCTLLLGSASGELEIQFSDNYPTQSMSVRRWDAAYVGTDLKDDWDKSESVELNENRFRIENDGRNYVYMVAAEWENGNSSYAFYTDNSSE